MTRGLLFTLFVGIILWFVYGMMIIEVLVDRMIIVGIFKEMLRGTLCLLK